MCLSCLAFLEMFTKPVTTIGTTATHAGCVQCRLGRRMPFKVQQHFHCRRRPKTRILQLNTEGLTANKISIIEQLAYKNKAFMIILQETHCATADRLVIPKFSLAGSVLSRNHGLATFVHEQLEWTLFNQSPEQSENEWLCVDVAGYT